MNADNVEPSKLEDIPVVGFFYRKFNTPKLWAVWLAAKYPNQARFWVGLSLVMNAVSFGVMFALLFKLTQPMYCPVDVYNYTGLIKFG